MKTYEIKLQKRTEIGKKATKKLRKEDLVPCEIYGGAGNIHCYGSYIDFEKSIHTPNVYLFNIDVDGEKRKAIVQGIQYHPVTDRIIHVDFLTVDENKPVKVNLPVELTGTSVGVMRGGKLRPIKRKVRVKGLLANIPATVKVDITKLDVGHSAKISQIKIEGVNFIDPLDAVVVNIGVSRATQKVAE